MEVVLSKINSTLFSSTTLKKEWELELVDPRQNPRKLPQTIAQFVMFHVYNMWP